MGSVPTGRVDGALAHELRSQSRRWSPPASLGPVSGCCACLPSPAGVVSPRCEGEQDAPGRGAQRTWGQGQHVRHLRLAFSGEGLTQGGPRQYFLGPLLYHGPSPKDGVPETQAILELLQG